MERNVCKFNISSHRKYGPCLTRPAYREGRRKTAVKVYTAADESCYLLVFGVPSIGLDQTVRRKCRMFGFVECLISIPEYPDKERFTDVFLVKFKDIHVARMAKRSLDDHSFYGGLLHVCYAPEYETTSECRLKLYNCRHANSRAARKIEHDYFQRLSAVRTLDHCVLKQETELSSESSTSEISLNTSIGENNSTAQQSFIQNSINPISSINPNNNPPYLFGGTSNEPLTCWRVNTNSTHLTENNTKRLMLTIPVQQALSFRPYSEELSTSSNENSGTNLERDRTLKRNLSMSSSEISLRDLKHMAFKFGPVQGPTLSHQNQNLQKNSQDTSEIYIIGDYQFHSDFVKVLEK